MKLTKFAAIAAVAIIGCTSCFAFAGCGEDPGTSQGDQQQAVTLTGAWKVESITVDGKTQSLTDWGKDMIKAQLGDAVDFNSNEGKQALAAITAAFDSLKYEFKEDGTLVASASAMGQTSTQEGTYEEKDGTVTFTIQGQTGELKFDAQAGTLSVEQQDMTLVMKKA